MQGKLFIITLLLLVMTVNVSATSIDSIVKESVKESINDIKDATKESIKEALTPNIDKASFGTLAIQLSLIFVVGFLIMALVAGIDELHIATLIKYTMILICVHLIAGYIHMVQAG